MKGVGRDRDGGEQRLHGGFAATVAPAWQGGLDHTWQLPHCPASALGGAAGWGISAAVWFSWQ